MSTQSNPNNKTQSGIWYLSGQISDDDGVRRFPLSSFPCIVGRRSDLIVSLPSNSVSKSHAEFTETNGQLYLRDLGSTNGTYVNGQQISDATLINEGDLIQFAAVVFRIGVDRPNTEAHTLHENACDRAFAMMQFDRLINDSGVVPFFQPIVRTDNCEVVGYEVLGRSRLFGLKTPAEMFSAASKLNLEAELSRELRIKGIELCCPLIPDLNIFVNTHPIELAKPGLKDSLKQIRKIAPDLPITLEIHEAAITNSTLIVELKACLTDLNIQLAFDDFGVGRARLVELSEVRPDFVKFDMKLTRDIHRATAKRQEVVALIAKMVNDLGIVSLAEGVEEIESHNILKEMNFKLAQGYHYGKPEPINHYVSNTDTGADTVEGIGEDW